MKTFLKRRWFLVLSGVLFLFLLVQYGGTTVVVLNRISRNICEVHISTSPEETHWGPNRLIAPLPSPQSRDLRLPIYLNLFTPAVERVLYTWAVDCSGEIVNTATFTGSESLYIWEVTR